VHLDSPAKVNLELIVGPVDETGYHPVDTTIHLLEFADTVAIEDAEKTELVCNVDLGIPSQENLAFNAARLMAEEFERDTNHRITLAKRIPAGAGLGGGSSNAAAVIKGLASMWGISLDDPRITKIAQTLGADVAVFLAPTPASRMTGYGDEYVGAAPPRSGQPVVLVMRPDAGAHTSEVYRRFDRIGAPDSERVCRNDLADAASEVCPAAAVALEWLEKQPQTDTAQISGSGAACFAITSTDDDAQTLAQQAREAGFWSVATRLR
jgi:4-diphosphocytidyl-2-C-methyl-D-erythritol kinase